MKGKWASWLGWGVVALLAVMFAAVGLRFLAFDPGVLTEELRPNLVNHPIPFYGHVLTAPLAMLAGIWQFLPVTRRSSYHRWAGRLYVVTVGIASITGFIVAVSTEIGPMAGTGFMILAVLWFGATAIAYFKVRARDYLAHREWMIRSYALTCAAMTLRIILPAGMALGAGFAPSYIVAAWACWIINLLVAEWIIRTTRPGQAAPLPVHRRN